MINNLHIQNFRGINDLALESMTSLSIIAGENSAGKSSVLEALFLLLDYQAPDVFLKLNSFRGKQNIYGPDDIWGHLVQLGSTDPIVISADVNDVYTELTLTCDKSTVNYRNGFSYTASSALGSKMDFEFKHGDWREHGFFVATPNEIRREVTGYEGTSPPPVQSVIYAPALRGGRQTLPRSLGDIELQGRTDELIRALQRIDNRVSALVPISRPDGAELYVRFTDNSILPLSVAGDGLTNFAMFAMYILAEPSAIVLIDEIENGIHHSRYGALWDTVSASATQNNVQVLAVTHSYEFVADAFEACSEQDQLPGLFRLEKDKRNTIVTHYPPHLLKRALSREVEVR